MENKMAAVKVAMSIPGLDLVGNENQGLKRALDDEDETMEDGPAVKQEEEDDQKPPAAKKPRRKKAKRQKTSVPSVSKNPLMMLNEFKPGLEYKLESQEGPPHSPVFVVSVTVDGEQYQGRGPSKQKAKHDAAEKALQSIVQLPFDFDMNTSQNDPQSINVDFTDDTTEAANKHIFRNFTENGKSANGQSSAIERTKHPVMLLNELHPDPIDYQIEEEPTEQGKFICNIVVNDQEFSGSGVSKKKAKMAAAAQALMKVYGIRTAMDEPTVTSSGEATYRQPPETEIPQDVADRIAQLVDEKYKQLTSGLGEVAKRKVLASIVMTTSTEEGIQTYDIISIGTGTKFISGEHINDKGYAVNDCHGEIIARRGLRQFLYTQLELCADSNKQSSVLEIKPSGLYGLKEGTDFHLYISTSPCGDARVFSPHEAKSGEVDRHSMRKKRGVLRVKLENGEGTIPVANTGTSVQTWDGVIATEKLRTMSCSDKICKWNLVGLQGALLSNFMEPLYLKSIVLGSLYRYEHMARAMYERIGKLESLPVLYRQNQPAMNSVSVPESRRPGKAPKHSVNWYATDSMVENVDGMSGKLSETSQPSRLCKQAMFMKFLALWQKLKPNERPPNVYCDAKTAAADYQTAKEALIKAFSEIGLGIWLKKPIEQDEFGLVAAE